MHTFADSPRFVMSNKQRSTLDGKKLLFLHFIDDCVVRSHDEDAFVVLAWESKSKLVARLNDKFDSVTEASNNACLLPKGQNA